MTIKQSLNLASKKITHLEAEILLAHLLKKDKIWLYKNSDFKLNSLQIKKYQELVKHRQKGEPIAYITHLKEFYGLDFYVDERVLIPRPETEILVEEVINEITKCYPLNAKRFTIADIGTGSGCIAISLAKNLPNIKIYAIDISKKALQVAKINAKKHRVLNKIKFLEGDLLSPLKEKIDIIVANLPYVATDFKKFPDFDDINLHEPKIAFFAGSDGLDLIKRFFKQAPKYLKKGGCIFLEISYHQKKLLQRLIPYYFPNAFFNFKKDLANLDRILVVGLL